MLVADQPVMVVEGLRQSQQGLKKRVDVGRFEKILSAADQRDPLRGICLLYTSDAADE